MNVPKSQIKDFGQEEILNMGDLEKLLQTYSVSSAVVEVPKLKKMPGKNKKEQAFSVFPLEFTQAEIKIETIEDEVKAAFEELKKTEKDAEKFEDITPVVEQELDPSVYENTDYNLELTYGGKTIKGYYETSEAKGGENEVSYEHAHLEDAQNVANTARTSRETNKTYVERYLDEGVKAAVTEQYIISFARWQTMYNGKIHFN